MPQKEVLQDETTGEEQPPEEPDPSPQESVEPAADPSKYEGTEY